MTASKLVPGATINGVLFDGTVPITIPTSGGSSFDYYTYDEILDAPNDPDTHDTMGLWDSIVSGTSTFNAIVIDSRYVVINASLMPSATQSVNAGSGYIYYFAKLKPALAPANRVLSNGVGAPPSLGRYGESATNNLDLGGADGNVHFTGQFSSGWRYSYSFMYELASFYA